MTVLPTVWVSPFSPTVFWLAFEGTPSNVNVIYTSLKSAFGRLECCCWQGSIYLHSFGRCCLPSPRNLGKFELIHVAVQGHRRSSTLVPVTCATSLSVINNNFEFWTCLVPFAFLRYWHTKIENRPLACFPTAPCHETYSTKNRDWILYGENCMI